MSRPGGIFKNDDAARALFGDAYKKIPKSVFAVAAWYLADACSELGVGQGGEVERLRQEFEALGGQVIDQKQARNAIAALMRHNA